VSSDDIGAFADQNRIGKAEGTNAAGNFRDLGRAVGSRVSGIRNQPIERPVFDLQAIRSGFRYRGALVRHFTSFPISV